MLSHSEPACMGILLHAILNLKEIPVFHPVRSGKAFFSEPLCMNPFFNKTYMVNHFSVHYKHCIKQGIFQQLTILQFVWACQCFEALTMFLWELWQQNKGKKRLPPQILYAFSTAVHFKTYIIQKIKGKEVWSRVWLCRRVEGCPHGWDGVWTRSWWDCSQYLAHQWLKKHLVLC